MTVVGSRAAGEEREIALLAAARSGDEAAFGDLTGRLRREIHVHCYRMLGSLDDADDAVQETLLRAWRNIGRFEPRAPFRAWLYRIATNVCLTTLARPTRRGEVTLTDLEQCGGGAASREGEPVHLDPYPDRLFEPRPGSTSDPETMVLEQEHIELAFVAAVQTLPPRQRAALLLRDVIGYSAQEVAAMLETSVAGINSAMQRARATVEQERALGRLTRIHAGTTEARTEQALVSRLVTAWHAADVPAIVAALTEDAVLTMPPLPARYVGRDAIGSFLATVPLGGRLDRFRLVPTRTNRQPALAIYRRDGEAGPFDAYGILVLAIDRDAIASMVRFEGPGLVARCGLAQSLPG